MGNQLGVRMLAAIAAMRHRDNRLKGPNNKPTEASTTGKPARDRALVKAARAQSRRTKKKGGA